MSIEDPVVHIVLEDLKARYKEHIIAVYGIGSYFDADIPDSWVKNDIDIIVIATTLEPFPTVEWTDVRFMRRTIEGKEVWIGFNTLEGFQEKAQFQNQSFSNFEWSLLDIKYPDNSTLLYGKDIRDQLPSIEGLVFDYDDILARGLYHLDKSLGEHDQTISMTEFSKGVFKIGFYMCLYFNENFKDTRIVQIGKKLKETSEIVTKIEDMGHYFEEAIIFRSTGHYMTPFEELRKAFIESVFSLLQTGGLHRKMTASELKDYLATAFRGFPHLIQIFTKIQKAHAKIPDHTSQNISNLESGLQGINLTGQVEYILKHHRFKRKDGTSGVVASFLLSDKTGIIRVVIWDDEVRKRVYQDKNFSKDASVDIVNGYIRTGYDNKPEIHVGKYGNIIVHENIFAPAEKGQQDLMKKKPLYQRKKSLSPAELIPRLSELNIDPTKVSKSPCHYCGNLCSSSAKKCPKCGEPLTFNF